MIESLNDVLSFVTLLALTFFALRILIASLLEFKQSSSFKHTVDSVIHYRDNEDN